MRIGVASEDQRRTDLAPPIGQEVLIVVPDDLLARARALGNVARMNPAQQHQRAARVFEGVEACACVASAALCSRVRTARELCRPLCNFLSSAV